MYVLGATFLHWYRTKVVPQLGWDARDGAKVAEHYNDHNSSPKYKRIDSKLESRYCDFSTLDQSNHLRMTTVKPNALKHKTVGSCTADYYCFLMFPEDDDIIYVRKFTCKGCSKCDEGEWLECLNTDTCGEWLKVKLKRPKAGEVNFF